MDTIQGGLRSVTENLKNLYLSAFVHLYILVQHVLSFIFAPSPPAPPTQHQQQDGGTQLRRPRIAIIGAGLTGVSAASHCVGHGFEVKIFESRSKGKGLGGIWSRVNSTSALQIHSIMFRFHPSIQWESAYPTQQQIRHEIVQLWKRYDLERRTIFNTSVKSTEQDRDGKWIINGNRDRHGTFDGVIAAVGNCGEPKVPSLPQQEQFKGPIYHSSNLDGKDAKGKKVLIVGGGASAIEALEYAVKAGASQINVLSRSDKWIIPRNVVVDVLLASNVLGQETSLDWIPETLLRKFFYRDLQDIAPADKGLFRESPMVNSDLFDLIRAGKADWLRGDILSVGRNGIHFNHRARGVPQSGPGHEVEVPGDMIIMATGFVRPSLSFLPDAVFQQPYAPPNWYLQVFPPEYPSICANNSTYVNALATAGNYHIGIYTRLLLMFLVDPLTRPRPYWMERWIDMTRLLKRLAPTGAFDFITYAELMYWFVFCVLINPFRWKWAAFVFCGIGKRLPEAVVEKEDDMRRRLEERQDK